MPEDQNIGLSVVASTAEIPVVRHRSWFEPDRVHDGVRASSSGLGAVSTTSRSRRSISHRAAVPDVKVGARRRKAGIAGLSFLRGIPGGMARAAHEWRCRMAEKPRMFFVEARAVDGWAASMCSTTATWALPTATAVRRTTTFSRRMSSAVSAAIQLPSRPRWKRSPNRGSDPTDQDPHRRLHLQESRRKRRGTLVDGAGCPVCGSVAPRSSEMHTNFLLNPATQPRPTSRRFGETVRKRVQENSCVELEWEIKRIGVAK